MHPAPDPRNISTNTHHRISNRRARELYGGRGGFWKAGSRDVSPVGRDGVCPEWYDDPLLLSPLIVRAGMTRDEVGAVLTRVTNWPRERRAGLPELAF